MQIARTVSALPPGGRVLVPTMGALHAGHAALVREGTRIARERGLAGGCVASVFVNPTQFDESSDFSRYPRTLEADALLCAAAGASAVWAPEVQEMYPPGVDVPVGDLPAVATEPGLEDGHRPGHFAGVVQVVRRLFALTRPAAAVFGEKDWQQLAVVRAMVAGEGLGVEIIGWPTQRDADGMAMSSRNRFLSAEDRARGLSLRRALEAARGEADPVAAEGAMRRVLGEHGVHRADYAVVRDAATLRALSPGERVEAGRGRALIAARVGSVRLLDNAAWPG